MAHFFRIILFCFSFFLSDLSYALLQPEAQYEAGGILGRYSSADAACSAAIANKNNLDSGSGYSSVLSGINWSSPTTGSCSYDRTGPYDTVRYSFGLYTILSCPANSSEVTGGCACKSNYEEKDGQCKPVNVCPVGQHEEGGACVPDSCKPDEIRVNGLCVKEPECPKGQIRINGVCKEDNKCPEGKDYGIYETSGPSSVEYFCSNALLNGVEGCQVRVRTTYDLKWTDDKGVGHVSYSGNGVGTGGRCTGGSSSSSGPKPGGGSGGGGGGGEGGGGGPGNTSGGTGGGTGGTGGGTGGAGGGTGGGTGGGGTGGGGTGGGGTGDGGTGGGGTGGGGTGGGTGNNSGVSGDSPTKLPGVKPPKPVDKDQNGVCPPGTAAVNGVGLCYGSEPKEPDKDGGCIDGYIKIGLKCVPLTPTGGGGGNGNGNGDGDGGGSFGGSCMAGFSCKGDAIQCAIAREQHKRNCVLFNDESTESKLYDEMKVKTGDQTKDNPNNSSVSLSGLVNTSDALGGGACITDVNVTVWGHSVTLPLSQVCSSLAMFGNLLVAVSMLLAARIITRG